MSEEEATQGLSYTYKLSWESVGALGRGSKFYNGDNPNCRPEDVPDEYWHKTERLDTNPWDQFHRLKRWAASGEQLIRNVHLYKAPAPDVEWYEVDV